MISQLTNLLSLAQMSLVSCRLIYLTPYLAFPEGTIDPQLGVQARLILSQQVSLLLFYGFRRKKQDSWFKDKGPYYSQHSEQREHQDVDVSTLTPQTPQGWNGWPGDMPAHAVDYVTGKRHWVLGTCWFFASTEHSYSLSWEETLKVTHCKNKPENGPGKEKLGLSILSKMWRHETDPGKIVYSNSMFKEKSPTSSLDLLFCFQSWWRSPCFFYPNHLNQKLATISGPTLLLTPWIQLATAFISCGFCNKLKHKKFILSQFWRSEVWN